MIKSIAVILILLLFSVNIFALDISNIVSQEEISKAKKVMTFRRTGKIEMAGLTGTFEEIFMAPDKAFLTVDFSVISFQQGFDGQTAWTKDQNGRTMELAGVERKQMINSVYLYGKSYLLENRMHGETRHFKDSLIGNIEYSIFIAYPENGDSLKLFIDKENQRVDIYEAWMDDITIITYFKDFRSSFGYEYPYVFESISNEPRLNSTMTIDSMEINRPVNEKIFTIDRVNSDDHSFPENADSVTVPFVFSNGHIYIQGKVNGKKGSFILDSGAGINVIDKIFAAKIGLDASGDFPSKGVTGYGSVSLTQVDSISLAEVGLYNQVIGIIDLSAFGLNAPDNFIGILGYDFLSRFPIKINFKTKEMIFYKPDHFSPPPAEQSLDLEFFMKVPTAICEYDGREGQFLIDLGNPLGLILHNSFVSMHNLEKTFADKKKMESGIGGVGGISSAYAAVGKQFTFGPAIIESPPLIVADSEKGLTESKIIDGNIGTLLLQDFLIILDYSQKKLYVLPPEKE